ncbi:MAG: hypothetical protein AAGI91_08175 [Bacteroidota bacterium]
MKNPNEVLHAYLTDMHAVESHILEAVERQLNGEAIKDYPEAGRVVRTVHTTLEQHTTALQNLIEARQDGASIKGALKEALGDALGFAAGLYDKVRPDEVSRMIRDNYTALGLAAVSYHMLHTTALGLKNDNVASMALRHLKDLTPVLVDLSKVVCHVVAKELADEDKVFDGTVGPQAVSNTQEAWSGNHVEA